MDILKIRPNFIFGKLTLIAIITIVSCLGCGQKYERITVPAIPPPPPKHTKPINVALVLSSGGFRGAAHVGVIEVLEENQIPIDLIVGSSSGSLVGAFYADEPNSANLKEIMQEAKYEKLVDASWYNALQSPFYPTGPIQGFALQNFMLQHMRSRDFTDLKIPLVVVATSIMSNQMEVLQSGPIIPAVHASSALPPYFAPVKIYQDNFIDGGVISKVPVNVAKQFKPKIIIAVDISKKPSLSVLNNAFEIASRAMDISFFELARHQANEADFVIRPEIIGYGSFEDNYNEEFYLAGRKAALEKIDAIKKAVLKINS
jgi:NTE family protein